MGLAVRGEYIVSIRTLMFLLLLLHTGLVPDLQSPLAAAILEWSVVGKSGWR